MPTFNVTQLLLTAFWACDICPLDFT